MKLRHILIIASFVLINILIGYTLLKNKSDNKAENKKAPIVVPTLKVKNVTNKTERFNLIAFGEVSAYNQINVSAEVQGKLIKGNVELKPGVKFKKGSLLFKIKDTEAIYNIRAKKSGFINLMASILPDINVDYPSEYNKWVAYTESIKLNTTLPTLPSWKSNKEKVFLSSKRVLSDYFSIKSAEEQLTKFYVYAPFSGSIKDVFINQHSIVNPGARVMTIVQTSNYELPLAIPLEQANSIKIGTKANIYTTAGDLKAVGKVVRLSDVLNKKTQSIMAYVKPKAIDGKILIEGEYLKAELDLGSDFDGVRIPFQSIFNQNKVYIYQSDSTLLLKTITVLNENQNGVFVSGLKNDSKIVIQEVLNYTDSTKYKTVLK